MILCVCFFKLMLFQFVFLFKIFDLYVLYFDFLVKNYPRNYKWWWFDSLQIETDVGRNKSDRYTNEWPCWIGWWSSFMPMWSFQHSSTGNLVIFMFEKNKIKIFWFSTLRLHLFSYLSAEFIVENLGLVCKPLRQFIVSSQSYWKYRYGQRVRAPYRKTPFPNRTWLHVCHELEIKAHEWETCAEQHQNILSIAGPHIGPITDTILLEVWNDTFEILSSNSLIFIRRMGTRALQAVETRPSVVGIYVDWYDLKRLHQTIILVLHSFLNVLMIKLKYQFVFVSLFISHQNIFQ